MILKIAIAVLLFGGIFYFSLTKEATEEHHLPHDSLHDLGVHLSEEQIKEAGIELAQVKNETLQPSLKKSAKISLHPDRIVHILANERGKALMAYKNVGDSVKAGEPLALIQGQAIGEKKTSFKIALNKQMQAEESFERHQELFEKKIISIDDFKTSEADRFETAAQLELAKQELLALGLTLEEISNIKNSADLQKLYIRSPMEGIILDRHITLGENIDTTDPIYVMANLSKLWIEIPFFPSELSLVQKGQMVLINKVKTPLISLIPQVGQESYLAKGIAEVDNSQGLFLPGALIQVEILLEEHPAKLAVQKDAIQILEGKPHVFIETEKGFIPREVTLGAEDDKYVEIIAGLDAGEKYTAKQAFILKADLGKEDVADDD